MSQVTEQDLNAVDLYLFKAACEEPNAEQAALYRRLANALLAQREQILCTPVA